MVNIITQYNACNIIPSLAWAYFKTFFLRSGQKIDFGTNRVHMRDTDAFVPAFCTEFRPAYFWFLRPRADFWTTDPILGPPDPSRSTFWPGDLFGPNLGSQKTYFYYEIVFPWGFRGFPVTQMNCMVPRTHLGVLLCPKPLFFNYF